MFDFDVITGPGPLAALAAKNARRGQDQDAPKMRAAAEASIFSPSEPDRAAPLGKLAASQAVRDS